MSSVTTVEQLLTQVDAANPERRDRTFTLWVPDSLTFKGEEICQAQTPAVPLS